MARIRSIKPEVWADQKLARLSRDARLLYIALWNFADEQARMVGDPRQVKGLCFALDDDLSPADVDRLLGELGSLGRVVRYEVDGERYLHLPKLAQHQRLDARQPSRYPPPPEHAFPDPPQPPSPAPTDFPGEVRGDSGEDVGECKQVQPRARAYVAGSRLQVAGSRGSATRVTPQAADRARPLVIVSGDPDPPQTPAETAQTVLAAYIDWRRQHGINGLDRSTKGILARHLGAAFECGHDPPTIRYGLADWHASDTHPSTLPSFIDVRARGGQPRASPGKTQRQLDDIQRTQQQMRAIGIERGLVASGDDLGAVGADRRKAQRELP